MNKNIYTDPENRAYTSLDDKNAKKVVYGEVKTNKHVSVNKHISEDKNNEPYDEFTQKLKDVTISSYDTKELQKIMIKKTELDDALAGNFHLETLEENKTVNILSILDMELEETRMFFNPKSKERKAYLTLDSRFRSALSNDRTTISWNFINNANIGEGFTNALGFISDVTSFRIFDFYFRITDPNYQCDQMIFTVGIQEFLSQSFIAPESRRFHFWGKMATDNGVVVPPTYLVQFQKGADAVGSLEYLYRLSDGNDGLFTFRTPIKTLNTFTLSFGAPYTLIPIEQDTQTFTYVSGGTNSFLITTPPHNLPIGETDRVYISQFATDNVADDNLVQLLNNPPDNIVYVGTAINATQLVVSVPDGVSLDLVFDPIVGTQTPGALIYLDYFRFYITLEVTYMSPTNDL